jgi:hypothetical protein
VLKYLLNALSQITHPQLVRAGQFGHCTLINQIANLHARTHGGSRSSVSVHALRKQDEPRAYFGSRLGLEVKIVPPVLEGVRVAKQILLERQVLLLLR